VEGRFRVERFQNQQDQDRVHDVRFQHDWT
jgi:hypothetical protein